jgi:hypothetical protein
MVACLSNVSSRSFVPTACILVASAVVIAASAKVPEAPKNPYGPPLVPNLRSSDTPTQPLVEPWFADPAARRGARHVYRIRSVNTARLESSPTDQVTVAVAP